MWTPAASICSPLMSSLSPHPFDVSVKMFSNWLLMAASREERQGHRVFLRDNTKLFATVVWSSGRLVEAPPLVHVALHVVNPGIPMLMKFYTATAVQTQFLFF